MKKHNDQLEVFFKQLQTQLDEQSPLLGHEERFLLKLKHNKKPSKKRMWLPFTIAASLLFLVGMVYLFQPKTEIQPSEWQNASIQTKETHDYFMSVIQKELAQLQTNQTEETKPIIEDALKQMAVFDADYQKIMSELQKNGDTKQLLHAMILNFQTRISFLELIIQKIEIINHQQIIQHENSF